MQAIGPQYAQDYITRFGFDPKLHPPYLTMGLGAGSATPLQMAAAYAIFANGGYRVAPYLIAKVTDARGNVLSEAKPVVAGEDAERAIDPRNAFLMTTLLRDVIAFGTGTRAHGARAQGPRRQDRARPTRTSTPGSAASTRRRSASRGSASTSRRRSARTRRAAWPRCRSGSTYMQKALKGVPEKPLQTPEGVISVRINADTGLRDDSSSLSEWFFAEFPPRGRDDALAPARRRAHGAGSARPAVLGDGAGARWDIAGTPSRGRAYGPIPSDGTRRTAPASRRPRRGSSPSTASPTGRSPSARPRGS